MQLSNLNNVTVQSLKGYIFGLDYLLPRSFCFLGYQVRKDFTAEQAYSKLCLAKVLVFIKRELSPKMDKVLDILSFLLHNIIIIISVELQGEVTILFLEDSKP